MKRGLWMVGGVLAAGLVVGILVLGKRNPYTGRVQSASLTPEDETALGVHLAPRMSDELDGLDPSADAQGMVTAVGDRIVATTEARRSPYPFRFHVLADTAIAEAYGLPGGPIFVTRGLLDRLENEAQLAGVIAHQVAHVLARHAAKRFSRADTTDAAVARVLELRYAPEEEVEADTLSVRLVGQAGYDPRALLDLLRVAEEATRLGGGIGFSTRHPYAESRRELLNTAIARAFPQGIPSTFSMGRWFAPEVPDPTDPMEEMHPADSAAVLD